MKSKEVKISIAMATYNGEKFLQEQLNSSVAQTRRPDELIVCDDGSSDATVKILLQFQASAPFKVRIYENERNLGYTKNFENTMSLCSGDIVFLSDQDDVWFKTKVAIVEQAFLKNPKKMVIINNQLITDGHLRDSGATKLENTRRLGLSDSWFITGCCTALRREWVDFTIPIPPSIKAHDVWINHLADMLGLRVVLDKPLQLYRRHENNASEAETSEIKKVSRFKLLKVYGFRDATLGWETEIRDLKEFRRRIEERRPKLNGMVADKALDRAIAGLNERRAALRHRIEIVSLPRWRRWPKLLFFWRSGGYRQLYGWKSAVKDMIRP